MNRVSDERLDELVRRHERDPGQPVHRDIAAALRELRDYRKAVAEYLSARDAPLVRTLEESCAYRDRLDAARANLRTLGEK